MMLLSGCYIFIITGAGRDVYAVIWTTTPWTLPSNQAVCIGSELR